jgi:hypothetical protein
MGGQPGGYGQPPGPPMGGQPGGYGQPPMGGMPGQPPMGMPGQPMGGMPIRAFGGNVSSGGGSINKLKIIGGAVLAGLIAIGVIIGVVYSMTHATVHMINTTGRDGVSVFVDGVAIATNLKNAPTESWLASESKSVSSGSHKVEAKDSTGKVLESLTVDFEGGSNGYLYAPMHNKDVCFVIQTDVYGRVIGNGPKDIVLDRSKNLWAMPSSIDRWFQDTPDQVKLGKGQSSTTKRAVRQYLCRDL